MRRQIIIRNKFAKTLDQKFRKGQKVYYTKNFGNGPEYPAVILGIGKRDGDTVYDVRLDYEGAKEHTSWGYEDQFRARDGVKDDVGSPEDQAYAEGCHARRSDGNPYSSPELKAAYERGRKAAKTKEKMTANYFKGEIRGKRFEQPRIRDAKDFNSEQGWIAKIFAPNGKVVTQSEPYIAKGPAEAWLRLQLSKAQNAGLQATGRVFNGFFDPSTLQNA